MTVRSVAIGLALGVSTILLHTLLSEEQGLELTSLLMVLIASVYYGFALMSHHTKAKIIEIIVASAFVSMGIFGLWISPWILVIGLFLHGLWDIIHHHSPQSLAEVPAWYIPFCATYDWIIAGYLAYLNVSPA